MRAKWVLGVSVLAFAEMAYSACSSVMCQNVYVERLNPNANGKVYVATSGDETQLNCSAVSQVYLTFDLSEPAGNVFYSTLLAAQISDRKVSLRIVDGSQGCTVTYIMHDRQ
ncbi:hypothetical protein ACSVIJ_07810 [Pseudomonas sp. NCHU5208]|uniref:hypothetical protein n=1 Tax=unclassified Pseudomonas TaxID=196821 RepID=UPI003F97B79F